MSHCTFCNSDSATHIVKEKDGLFWLYEKDGIQLLGEITKGLVFDGDLLIVDNFELNYEGTEHDTYTVSQPKLHFK